MNATSPPLSSAIHIRQAMPADAPALAELVAELGYPTEQQELQQRLDDLTAAGDQVLVAVWQQQVVGFVLLHRTYFLHRPPDGRVVTLVVITEYRSLGIGQQLLRAAEQALLQLGCGRIEISSGARREAAHRFYLREGYSEQPKRFIKPVPAE
jgi:GNAT superfamily N-acetyltransferase